MKNRKKLIGMIGLPVLLLLAAAAAAQWQYQAFTVAHRYLFLMRGQAATKERLFRTSTGGRPHDDEIQYRKKDARPAIMEPQFVAANQAQLVAGTMGIGVSVEGESRFYPLFILQYHQIVNDDCGGKAVVCSY